MNIKEKKIQELKNKEAAENRAIVKKIDENDKQLLLPRKYKDKNIWVEITDEEIFEIVFPTSEHHRLAYFYAYWYFAKKNNKKLNEVPQFAEEKKQLLTKYNKEIETLIKARKITYQNLDEFTVFELKDFLNSEKIIKEEKKEEKEEKTN